MKKSSIGTTINVEIISEIRKLQSQLISKTNRNWSFSEILNVLLDIGLDNVDISYVIEIAKEKNK